MVVRLVLVFTTVALLVGPSTFSYSAAAQSALKVCLMLVFSLLLAAALSVCATARRYEVLAATATAIYRAVRVAGGINVNRRLRIEDRKGAVEKKRRATSNLIPSFNDSDIRDCVTYGNYEGRVLQH